jgi:hypothetical protein
MSKKGIIILSLIVLLALPLAWLILKFAGAESYLLTGFWGQFWIFAVAFVILVGGSILINNQKNK